MKINQPAKLFIILLLLNNPFLSYSQPDYFLTEFDAGKVIIKAIVPHANSVRIVATGGSWGLNLNENFTKNSDSAWQVTLDPAQMNTITPGFYYYNFQVNGVNTLNPNERAYVNTNCISGIEIPDPDNDFYDIKDVPHGTIRMQFYYSTVSKTYRKCFIYLPPAYDTRSAEKYPVLFLQHGMNETQYSWHMQGKVNFILDNLIAEGKALPMIIVMENGMTAVNYTSLVIDDLIPFLQENYKVKTGKPNTAVAGLSMGSYQATDLGLANSDKFGYVGAFCGGTDLNLSSISNQINDSIEVLFNGYGISDELNLGQSFESYLNNLRINHVNAEFSGGHEWQVWRKCLYQFAPLLFKPYTYENHFSAIEDNSQKAFSMYPNPAEGQIHLEFNEDEDLMNACYELNDITGRQILSFTGDKSDAETKISAALQSSSGALYILLVHTQKSVYQAKILN